MCAFMPTIANWIGARPAARSSISGRQATGQLAPVPSVACAAKYSPANTTSRRSVKWGSANVTLAVAACTALVTCMYSRLKYATPSLRGRAPSICSIRAMTWAIVSHAPGAVDPGPVEVPTRVIVANPAPAAPQP
jgi:hypothetical protein